MENYKTSPHTRTSTSTSALTADVEDILGRLGIQFLGLLDLAAALARIPAVRQALLHHAPDADGLLQPTPIAEGKPDQPPKTIAERIAVVRRALAEADTPEEMSMRAVVHQISGDLRAAHPRRSWPEIAEIFQQAGFTGATADNIRQSFKSAPVGPVVPPKDEMMATAADGPPPSSPGQPGTVMPGVGKPTVPNPIAGGIGSVPTRAPDGVTAASLDGPGGIPDHGSKRFDDGRPVDTPRMPSFGQVAPASVGTPDARQMPRDDARGSHPKFDSDRGGVPDHNSRAPVREAAHLLSDARQPAGVPSRPIVPVAQPQPPRPALAGSPYLHSGRMTAPASDAAPTPASGLDHRAMPQRDLPPDPAQAAPARDPDRRSFAPARPDVLSQPGGMPVAAPPTPSTNPHDHPATSPSPAIPDWSVGRPVSVVRLGPTPAVPRPNWSAAPAPAHPEDSHNQSASRSRAVPDQPTSDDDDDDDEDDCFGSGPRI